MRVLRQGEKWTPAQRPLPVPPPRPLPVRVTVPAGASLYGAAVSGRNELCLPASPDRVDVGDIVHLVEHGEDGNPTGRCCYRMVTRRRCPAGGLLPVTVLPGTGQCEGRHQ